MVGEVNRRVEKQRHRRQPWPESGKKAGSGDESGLFPQLSSATFFLFFFAERERERERKGRKEGKMVSVVVLRGNRSECLRMWRKKKEKRSSSRDATANTSRIVEALQVTRSGLYVQMRQ